MCKLGLLLCCVTSAYTLLQSTWGDSVTAYRAAAGSNHLGMRSSGDICSVCVFSVWAASNFLAHLVLVDKLIDHFDLTKVCRRVVQSEFMEMQEESRISVNG